MSQDILNRIALTALVLCNFFIYEVLNKQSGTVHVVKLQFEEQIPFLPFFSIPYISFIPFLLITIIYLAFFYKKYQSVFISFLSCQLIAYLVYTFYQTSVSRADIVSKDIFSTIVAYIYSVDKPYNCFPSLHVSLSMICLLYWIKTSPVIKIPMSIFVALIILSTLFIKQHYVLDVMCGIILGILTFYIGQVFNFKFIISNTTNKPP
ncbi:inositol phosphorylceramide synthase [Trichocoleus sp. FACHB-90]|uniref:phosphatase PAP2 family protein n=1 Tax=Cyanophyceae TaxID=3028117 RepID=UPI001681C3AE|nr:phosphatase PAP2 family protein [Trichocoleus sp. FACHB-90]MBD1929941.1 inositol phosphorylceramide synthase [Trichocoleus sp. FACHB-90]